jgi:3-deoxy-D-manno-octulosonate 8-phosphate phosphatase KdsC-like HAD superfamily phosphatase
MKRPSPELLSRLAKIKLFLCDVDGVLTDGSIYIGGAREIKRYNIQDGLGLVLDFQSPFSGHNDARA